MGRFTLQVVVTLVATLIGKQRRSNMNEILIMLSMLLCCHFLLDFAIQGDFVAKFKARNVDGNHNTTWKWVLTAHAASHTLPVIILTQSLLLGGIMFL